MSLKSKLITTISMFVLVLVMTIVGVFAVTSATVNMGGNITFVADDVYARITGKIEGANEPTNLAVLNYTATSKPRAEELSTWINNLTFKSATESIKITVTVENLAQDRWLLVNVEDKITSPIANLIRKMEKGGQAYTSGTNHALAPSTGEGTSKVEFVLTLSVENGNYSITDASYDYIIHLNNSNEEPEQPAEELEFTFDGNKVTGYTGTETNIRIPSSYSIQETEATEFIVTLADFSGETPEGRNKVGILMALSGYTLHLSNGNTIICSEGFYSIQDNIDEIQRNLPMTVDLTGVDLTFTVGVEGPTQGQEQALGGFLQGYWYKQATDSDWVDSSVTPLPETLNYPVEFKVNVKTYKYFEGNDYTVDTIGAIFSLPQSGTDTIVLTIPSTIKNIDPYAFQYNTVPFTVVFEDKAELPAIGEYAFATDSLKSLILPQNLKVIPENAFYGCSGLTELTIPSSLTEIGGAAFYGCSGITELVIPNSVTTIGGGAFDNCTGIKKLTYNSNLVPVDCGDGPWNNTYFATENFGSPDGLEVIIGPDVKVIYNGIFSQSGYGYYSNTNILKITIQGDVELIENNAFERCNKLVSINFPSSLKTIGVEAFQYCNSLQSVIFEEGSALTTISASAFSGCISITGELIIPARVTTIGDDSFRNCSGLTSLTFADNSQLITIGNSAFDNCSGLIGNLIIPEGVETIGDYAFFGCRGLTGELKIPEGVTTIGEGTFLSCEELTSVNLPSTIKSIGSCVFNHCYSLAELKGVGNSYYTIDKNRALIVDGGKSIIAYATNASENSYTIPVGVKTIGDSAFSGCAGLTSITIPSSVTSIEPFAFSNCSELKSITIYATTPPTLGSSVFYGVHALDKIYVYGESVEIYKAAEGWSGYSGRIQAIPEP